MGEWSRTDIRPHHRYAPGRRRYECVRTGWMYVWLWFAGNRCGVSDDRGRAMEHAQAHLANCETVLVEHARLTQVVQGTMYLRTGHRFTARLVCGRARWTEVIEAEAS
jgi:hypothetical protein